MMKLPILYARTSTGKIQSWEIVVEGNTFYTKAGQVGGKITESKPTVCSGKNLGKANESTPEDQAGVEALAKWEKKCREGYFENVEDVDKVLFIEPILAYAFKKRKKPIPYPVIINLKYNGCRCVISKNGAFSRTGKKFHNIKHIVDALQPLFDQYPNLILDGELFNFELKNHLNRLIELVAVTREEKDITEELRAESEKIVNYYIYDGYFEGNEADPYINRFSELERIINKEFSFEKIHTVEYEWANNREEVFAYAKRWIDQNYEGAILRVPNMPYVHKRSMDLLKIKTSESEEFEVVGFTEGTGNWAGIAKTATCRLPNGETFESNLRGTMPFLREVWENPKKYIGQKITVDFQEYSEYGVPLIPYSDLIIRNYE